MTDFYFKRPLLWDFVIATFVASTVSYYFVSNKVAIPDREKLNSIVSDLSTIALTLAGFVLTLLTVLISFKSSFDDANAGKRPTSTFKFFFTTSFYFRTVHHLKHAILSLTLVSLLGYILKLIVPLSNTLIIFAYDLFGVMVVFLTVWRCLTMLSKIIKLQQDKANEV